MPASTRTPAFFVGWQSRPISRILCTRHVRKRDARSSHSSRRAITDALKLPTRRRDGGPVLHLEDASLPTWNCSGWRLPCRSALQQPRCALTAPFHPYLIPACAGPSAVCFLLPFLALFGRNRRGRDCLACFAGAHFNTVTNLRGFSANVVLHEIPTCRRKTRAIRSPPTSLESPAPAAAQTCGSSMHRCSIVPC